MGIIKSAADLVYTFRFLKLLVTPFDETPAFKAGIIDADGVKRKDFNKNTMDNRNAYANNFTAFHRLVYNVKRAISNAPGGKSRVASYASALYLIREQFGVKESKLVEALKEQGLDLSNIIIEDNQWFMLENNQLSPGIYRIKNNKVLNSSLEEMVKPFDKVRIGEDSFPVGNIFGLNIYEALHIPTKKKIYITSEELLK
jgi:hypothetical protein